MTRLIQILIGSLLPLLILLFGTRLFGRKIGIWAACIAIFYPTFIYFDSSLLITFLITLLTTFLIWILYKNESFTLWKFIIAGIVLGLAGLARPNILLIGPFLFIWFWFIIKPKIGLKKH